MKVSSDQVVGYKDLEHIDCRAERMRTHVSTKSTKILFFRWNVKLCVAANKTNNDINFIQVNPIVRLFQKLISPFYKPATHPDRVWESLKALKCINQEEEIPVKNKAFYSKVDEALKQFFNRKIYDNQLQGIQTIDNRISTEKTLMKNAGFQADSSIWSNEKAEFKPQYFYPPISTSAQEARLNEYTKLLLDLKDKLDRAKIPFWIDAGTLLGVYRFGDKQLPHDYDADICIPFVYTKQVAKILTDIARDNPDKYEFDDIKRNDPGFLLRLTINGLEYPAWLGVDTCKFRGDNLEMSYDPVKFGNCEQKFVFPLKKCKFYDGEVWVPNQTENYLKTRYGILEPLIYWDSEKKRNVADLEHKDINVGINTVYWRRDIGDMPDVYIPRNVKESRALKEKCMPKVQDAL